MEVTVAGPGADTQSPACLQGSLARLGLFAHSHTSLVSKIIWLKYKQLIHIIYTAEGAGQSPHCTASLQHSSTV